MYSADISLGKFVYPNYVTVLCNANQSNFFINLIMLSLLN